MVNVHARYIDVLESEGWLDRALEFLPTDKQIAERQASGAGLQTPEFAVLIAYTKNANVAELVRSNLPGRARCSRPTCSPTSRRELRERFADAIQAHPLRREIVATRRREPDGQPVGHLVRPPDDGGHRRVGRRRDPGVDRRPARCSASPQLWAEIDALTGRGRRSTPSSSCSSTAGGWSSGARCGCCATAARRSTSARRSPSSARAWPAGHDAGAGARRADGRRGPLGRGVAAGRGRARAARRAGRGLAAAAHRLRPGRARRARTGRDVRRRGPGPLGDLRPPRPARGSGRASARCPVPTAGRPRPGRRCATTCSTALAELTATVIESADGVGRGLAGGQRAGRRPGGGDVHRDPAGRELRPDHAVRRPAPAAQPGPDVRHRLRAAR